MKWTICSPCSRRAGLTLIEVIAAIAILGTVLVALVIAKSRHTRQTVRAERARVAVRAADELIANWWMDDQQVPIGKQGRFEDTPSIRWRTRLVSNQSVNQLDARVVRVEILHTDERFEPTTSVLFNVDLVLPEPEKEPVSVEVNGERP